MRSGRRPTFAAVSVLATLATSLACAAKEPPARKSGAADLVGAGATFPYPLYRAWFSEFERREGVRINYFAVGSSEGMRLLERGDLAHLALRQAYLHGWVPGRRT
jgi:ABC-type phosphate transport system substrate-binding protein